jgi:TRAP-type mannitol/chloroaromatic compound transport system permease large subunit
LVFRGYGGDEIIHNSLADLPGGIFTAMLLTMVVIFLLGFILDFIEIIFVVVPIVTPILLHMGADPVWLAIMIAVNLQTSFLTPPFGFALFYLRGVAPKSVLSIDIYKGIIPFVIMQILVMCLLALLPSLATKLPDAVYGKLESNNVIQPYHYGDPVDF